MQLLNYYIDQAEYMKLTFDSHVSNLIWKSKAILAGRQLSGLLGPDNVEKERFIPNYIINYLSGKSDIKSIKLLRKYESYNKWLHNTEITMWDLIREWQIVFNAIE